MAAGTGPLRPNDEGDGDCKGLEPGKSTNLSEKRTALRYMRLGLGRPVQESLCHRAIRCDKLAAGDVICR